MICVHVCVVIFNTKMFIQVERESELYLTFCPWQEAQNYPTKLDAIETEIRRTRAELKELKAMQNDAELSKEASVNELKRHEETVYAERKKREIELQKMKKEAEEKKMQHERIEKRLVSPSPAATLYCHG